MGIGIRLFRKWMIYRGKMGIGVRLFREWMIYRGTVSMPCNSGRERWIGVAVGNLTYTYLHDSKYEYGEIAHVDADFAVWTDWIDDVCNTAHCQRKQLIESLTPLSTPCLATIPTTPGRETGMFVIDDPCIVDLVSCCKPWHALIKSAMGTRVAAVIS